MKIKNLSTTQVRQYFAARLPQARFVDGDKQYVRCPFHQDAKPSMSINFEKMVWKCHANCGEGGLLDFEQKFSACDPSTAHSNIAEILGIEDTQPSWMPKPEAVYKYIDEAARLLYEKLRLPGKHFRFRKPDGKGWDYELGDVRRVLYRLPEVVTANHVFVCEGEKDADNVSKLELSKFDKKGFTRCAATTNDSGAGKWNSKFSPYFSGKAVAVMADNDPQGKRHAQTVAASVFPYAQSVRLVELPGLPENGDVSDYLAAHSASDFLKVVKGTPLWSPPKVPLFLPALEFMDSARPEIEWLIDGVIQKNANGFIVSDPKVGKSITAMDIAISLALGSHWMEFDIPDQTRVAVISREDNPGLTGYRMHKLLKGKLRKREDLDGWLYVNTKDQSPEFKIDKPDQLAEMLNALREIKPGLVILDVLNRLHSADENDQTEMRAVLDCADIMHKELNCSIGIIHHFNKQEKGRLTHRMRGSSAIAGWAEWIIGLEYATADKNEVRRTMEFEIKAVMPHDMIYWQIFGDRDSEEIVLHRIEPPERHRGTRGNKPN